MRKNQLKALIGITTAVSMFLMTGCIGGSSAVEIDTGLSSASKLNSDSIELKLGMPVPNSGAWGAGVTKFAELIEERSEGKYHVTIYGNDELSGGNQVGGLEMLQQGATDLQLQDCLIWSSIEPKLALPAFPWLMPSEKVADKILGGAGGDVIKGLISDSSAVCIGIGSNGYRQVVNTKKPVSSPGDLTGLKIRVPGISMYVSLFKQLGADPVTMNASERYTALQQGAIDGCENPLELHITQKDAEVVKYCTVWNYSYDPVFFCASEKLWAQLSDDEKKMFEKCGQEAMDTLTEVLRSSEAGYREKMISEYGIEFTDLTDEQIDAFREKTMPIYEEFKDSIGVELFEAFGYSFQH